jgi:ATP-dependent DNA ligase
MDCLPVSKLHEGPEWTYETKLDGYRLEAVRRAGRTTLYFRRQNVPNQKFHYIATALQDLPNVAVALKVGSSFRLQARRVDPQRILG